MYVYLKKKNKSIETVLKNHKTFENLKFFKSLKNDLSTELFFFRYTYMCEFVFRFSVETLTTQLTWLLTRGKTFVNSNVYMSFQDKSSSRPTHIEFLTSSIFKILNSDILNRFGVRRDSCSKKMFSNLVSFQNF